MKSPDTTLSQDLQALLPTDSKTRQQLSQLNILFMASGSGTNVENVLTYIKHGDILAKPIGVLTNKPNAGVIERAKAFGVTTQVIASRFGKNAEKRQAYEEELLKTILSNQKNKPNLIVLAGWMLILSDAFIAKIQQNNIVVINLHPALLSGKSQNTVASSAGKIPEIRGANAIHDAHQYSLEKMPVTGVTVHTVNSGAVDAGDIILTQEVKRQANETEAELTQRIHHAEYRALPLAIQKILLQIHAQQKGQL